MTKAELEAFIRDSTVSDEDVEKAVKGFLLSRVFPEGDALDESTMKEIERILTEDETILKILDEVRPGISDNIEEFILDEAMKEFEALPEQNDEPH